MTSIVFPGQGSQYFGMAKDFHDNFKLAKLLFEEIEDYTNIDLRRIIFNNENDKLDITKYTQIAIFSTSYVIYNILSNEKGLKNEDVNVMLGHSLGEYTSLACCKKLTLKDCSLILKKRGELMHSTIAPKQTGMAALIGKNQESIKKIIHDNNLDLEIANDNSPMQIVISGNLNEIDKSKEIFLDNQIKKFILLNVSAAFHSRYMIKAQNELSKEIESLDFVDNNVSIISNYDAQIYNDTSSIKKNLQNQMANMVKWTKSIIKLENIGEKKLIEIGPNKVLSGLIRRISKNFDIVSIDKVSDLDLYEQK